MLQDTIVCKHGSSNVYTNTHSNQAFALYPELKGKGKGKTRLSWRVTDYPNHKMRLILMEHIGQIDNMLLDLLR